MVKTVYVGADHAGFKLKERMKKFLQKLGYRVVDLGNKKLEPKDDYPDYGYKVAKAVAKTGNKGILFCGSSEGVCIVANKIKRIRAVPVMNVKVAKKSREDDDANILCLSGWFAKPEKAKKIIKTWLKTEFSGAKRHVRRIGKIGEIERKERM